MPDTTGEVVLREIVAADLPIFFAQQLDPVANRMAAFTANDPADRERFDAHWAKILGDETTVDRTVCRRRRSSATSRASNSTARQRSPTGSGESIWGGDRHRRPRRATAHCQRPPAPWPRCRR